MAPPSGGFFYGSGRQLFFRKERLDNPPIQIGPVFGGASHLCDRPLFILVSKVNDAHASRRHIEYQEIGGC